MRNPVPIYEYGSVMRVKLRGFRRTIARSAHANGRFVLHSKKVVEFTWTHPANKGARARALFRLARFQARGRVLHRRTLATLGDRSCIWAYLHRYGSLKVLCANLPDHPEMLAWRRVMRPGDLFVDVGANIGSYAIWAGELGAEVIALEPADDTFALLVENVALNGYRIEALQAAAGAACGTAWFTSGRDVVNRIDVQGSVETVMVTIDSVVGDRTVAGMKVDVEGFEIDVLRGCGGQPSAASRPARQAWVQPLPP
jgi:FkbM family methyltransferase